MDILLPVLMLSALGLAFGLGLAYANKIFFVGIDPRTEEILSALPGTNCGACGFAGCEALAEAMAKGRAAAETCIPGGQSVHEKVAAILGVEAKQKTKMLATLICNGGKAARDKYDYRGPADCFSAGMLSAGQKACEFGCLGFGTCVNACPFGAIKMGPQGLPVIDQQLCTGCGKCVNACPKKILILRSAKSHIWVACNSTDRGAVVTKACRRGCIGCGKCVAACKFDAIKVVDNLAKIDYDKCTNCRQCVDVCPTKVILTDYTEA